MNIGIIGAGGIAHKLHLPQVAGLRDGLKGDLNGDLNGDLKGEMRVTHLAGRKESRLRVLAERFDVPHWTTDYTALLSDDSIDGIIVALPHPLHVPVGLEVLAAGKHLMMQKPLCADMGEAHAFVEAVERSDRAVFVLPHFGPDVYAIRRLLAEGAIGKPTGAHCRVSHGGPEVYYAEIRDYFGEENEGLWFFQAGEAAVGALFDMGVYAVAALVAVMGSVESVMGEVATLDKATSLEDTATLLLRFANGAIGTAETGWCDPARTWQMRVHGTSGKLETPGRDGAQLTRWEPGSYTREDEPAIPHPIDVAPTDHPDMHAAWLRCIREGGSPALSHAQAARHVTEILLAGLESARSGQRIAIKTRRDPE